MRGPVRIALAALLIAACGKNHYALVSADADGGTPNDGGLETAPIVSDGGAGDDTGLSDASDDASETGSTVDGGTANCDLSAPFGAPKLLGFDYDTFGATFTTDELTVVVEAFNTSDAGLSDYDLFIATRARRTDAFPAFQLMASVSTAGIDEDNPSLSPDGKTLYFNREEPTPSGGSEFVVYKATRASVTVDFDAPIIAPEFLNDTILGIAQANSGRDYFGLYDGDNEGQYDLTLFAPLAKTMPTTKLGGVAVNTAAWDYAPAITADELTLYFTTTRNDPERASNGPADIYVATRTTQTADFGSVTRVAELNGDNVDDIIDWVSPDGCRVYFSSTRKLDGDDQPNEYIAEKPAMK